MNRIGPVALAAVVVLISGCSDTDPAGTTAGDGNANNGYLNNASNNGNNGQNNAGPECGDGLCEEGEDTFGCPTDCAPPGPTCGDGVCEGEEAYENCPDDCEAPEPVCGDGTCEGDEAPENCPDDCGPPQICTPGDSRCLSLNAVETCNIEGTRWERAPCVVGTVCVEERGICLDVVCRPGTPISCASLSSLNLCDETGTGITQTECIPPDFCDFINGVFVCTDQICTPGETRCAGLEGQETCAEDGTFWVPAELCPSGTQCDAGRCRSLCEINSKVSSFLGCDYFSVDMDNIEGGTDSAHAVVVSNPHPDLEAVVEVFDGQGRPVRLSHWNLTIPPGGQGVFTFPNGSRDVDDNRSIIDTRYVDGTMVGDQSFLFRTSIPTTAHQFNPLIERNVFTNDASLLLPTNALGSEYLVMSWKHRGSGFTLRGFVLILAFGEEPTTVDVTPSVTVVAGQNKVTNEAITAIGGGETRQFVLMPGQYLNLETQGPAGADLTGTHIQASSSVVVFGGHECANIPLGTNYCDHIEQQLFPVGSWGAQFVVSAFVPRGNGDSQVFRILASEDQTLVTTNPPQPNANDLTLNRGEFVEFTSNQDFEVSATAPILVGQYMQGSRSPGGASRGDPAFTLAVAIEQWRMDYIVLTPQAYNQGDYVNVIARTGTEVILDAAPIGGWLPVADGSFSVAKVAVQDGPHTLVSEATFTVILYGYDSDVSYAYPGGLNLENINQ
jgi:hypothetical protein